ncbi:MAG: NADH-quinone oxidoreductase subunit H, partial [Planctomycetota bacterium]
EDLVPKDADHLLFRAAPYFALIPAALAFVALPFGATYVFRDLDVALVFILAMLGVEVVGVIMAGWASNNKWSILGAMREAAQMVSYEIPLGLCVLIAVMLTGTLNLREMCLAQEGGALGCGNWLIWRIPPFGFVSFVIFYISLLANTKRAPFDLPEAESELVSGFHTEYSGIRFSFFFLEEYAAMFLVSGVAVCTYLGGWNVPYVSGELLTGSMGGQVLAALVIFLKSFVLVFVMIWVRWTLPRIRIDQVMNLCYKYLTPMAFVCLIVACLWETVIGESL